MRSPLTRPEAGLAGLAALVLVVGGVSTLALDDDDGDGGPAAASPGTRSAAPSPTRSASPSPSPSAAPTPPAAEPSPQETPVDAATPAPGSDPAPPPPAPEQRPPDQVALAFFDAAVQGRDADALAVGEAQALADLREYEAWESHGFTGCLPEKGHSVCVFETDSTFLRLVLAPDATTGWRVLAVE